MSYVWTAAAMTIAQIWFAAYMVSEKGFCIFMGCVFILFSLFAALQERHIIMLMARADRLKMEIFVKAYKNVVEMLKR